MKYRISGCLAKGSSKKSTILVSIVRNCQLMNMDHFLNTNINNALLKLSEFKCAMDSYLLGSNAGRVLILTNYGLLEYRYFV